MSSLTENEQLLDELRGTIAMLQQKQEALESELSGCKRSEEKLAQVEHALAETQRIGHVGSWALDIQSGEMTWSDELFRICGLQPQSVTPTMEWVIATTTHPEDRAAYQDAISRLMAGERQFEAVRSVERARHDTTIPTGREIFSNILLRLTVRDHSFEIERRIMRPDGTIRFVVDHGELIFDDSNALIRILGSVADVTEMKESEQKLQESEERFRSLVDMSSDWYWEQDAWMRFTKVFPDRSGVTGDRPEQALGLTPWELPVQCDEATRQALNSALEAREPYHDLESWLSVPGKPTRCFVSSGKPMFDAAGQFTGYRGVTKDVTERVRTIEDLRRFRAAMDATTDAIFLVDHATLAFVDANAAACRLVGYTREELLSLSGADLASISTEALKALSNDLVNGKDRGVETLRMRHKDGSKVLVEMQRRALSSGPDWIIVVVARDIRERRRTEAALRQSEDDLRQLAAHQEHIKEEERKRIAREIHDELGGVLTGIKANISVSMDRAATAGIPGDPLLVDAVRLADAAIETVRRVISDLRPSVLDQLGVWAALEWYAQQVQTRTGLQCSCIVSNSASIIEPDPERSTMLFRVVQEALTNVVRHAAASHVAINVWREEDALLVEIRDDGKGIDAQRLLDGDSWGILGMHERARHFGGTIKFSGTQDKGTAVLLHLPLENTNNR